MGFLKYPLVKSEKFHRRIERVIADMTFKGVLGPLKFLVWGSQRMQTKNKNFGIVVCDLTGWSILFRFGIFRGVENRTMACLSSKGGGDMLEILFWLLLALASMSSSI